MSYKPVSTRYDAMEYRRCGRSGLLLPAVSLGLWHNFGGVDTLENCRKILQLAFDSGITHFDLANNYGPPPGSAEENFGRILKQDFHGYRDQLIISTKAGYYMWPGPYGEWGSKKYLVSSLDQSLKRMKLDYVDIFYHHRPDPETPLEETMSALDLIVRQGKALYAGISNYPADEADKAIKILKELGTPCLIHQPKDSMFERWVEGGLLDVLEHDGVGCGRVEDKADPLAFGVQAGKGDDSRTVGLGPRRLGLGPAVPLPLVEVGEHEIRTVNLVAGGAKILADGAKVGTTGNDVLHEAGGLGLIGVVGRTGMEAQLGPE